VIGSFTAGLALDGVIRTTGLGGGVDDSVVDGGGLEEPPDDGGGT
jgi:hypothetical protein